MPTVRRGPKAFKAPSQRATFCRSPFAADCQAARPVIQPNPSSLGSSFAADRRATRPVIQPNPSSLGSLHLTVKSASSRRICCLAVGFLLSPPPLLMPEYRSSWI